MFDEGQAGGGVDEDRIIRFDAFCSEARDRVVHPFAFVERKFDPALVWADGPPWMRQFSFSISRSLRTVSSVTLRIAARSVVRTDSDSGAWIR